MGVFTQIEINIEFATEADCDRVEEIVRDFEDEIKAHVYKDDPFYAKDLEILDGTNTSLVLAVNAGREANAKFQVNCLIKLMQHYKVDIDSFNADITQPMSYLCLDGTEDFNEYEVDLS